MGEIGSTSIENLPTIQEDNKSNENVIINNQNNQLLKERENDINNANTNANANANTNTNTNTNTNATSNTKANANNNELNNQILKAGNDGLTRLPHRDVPMNTNVITNDAEIKSDFIPNENQGDYITEHLSTEDIIKQNINRKEDDLFLDKLYSELSLPLLISILYFIFKLPMFDNVFHQIIPFCYSKTGNMKISGYLITSLMFGLIVYVINKIIKNISI
jgi:hypothetical protein